MENKRKLKRYSVYLNVYSQETDELIGYAENLHTEGLLLSTKQPIVDKKEFEIWLGAKREDKHLDRIFLSAYRVWHSPTKETQDVYFSGLQFFDPSEESIEKIKDLIRRVNN